MTTTELTLPAAAVAQLEATLDERTRTILQHRRASAVVHRRGWLIRRALAGADVIGLTVAFFSAVLLFGGDSPTAAVDRIDPTLEVLLFVLTLPAWVVIAKLYGLYDRDEERTDHSTADDFGGVFHMITVGAWGLFAGAWLTDLADPQLDKLVSFWVLAILFVCAFRASARAYCRRRVEYLLNTIIVGAGEVGQLIAKKYLSHPEYGINLVGFVDERPKARDEELGHLTIMGGPDDLPTLIELFDIERIVLAFSNEPFERELELIRAIRELDVQVDIVPRLFEAVGPGGTSHIIEGIPMVGLAPYRLSRSSRLMKRSLDLALCGIGLVILAPLLVVAALAIRLESPGPVFYRHERIGRGGRLIRVNKFRTMRTEFCQGENYGGEGADAAFETLLAEPSRRAEFEKTYKLQDDPRVTRVGRFFRRTSIDELPQLLNVVRGDLSLVGPRPIVADELKRYGEDAKFLLDMLPGITGYWQINGRSRLDYADRVRLDIAYVTAWSLRLDLAILAKTGRTLLSRQGAY